MMRTRQKTTRTKLIRMPEADTPNYLGEAFRIAPGQSPREPERAHLTAVIAHCRKLVKALMNLPEME